MRANVGFRCKVNGEFALLFSVVALDSTELIRYRPSFGKKREERVGGGGRGHPKCLQPSVWETVQLSPFASFSSSCVSVHFFHADRRSVHSRAVLGFVILAEPRCTSQNQFLHRSTFWKPIVLSEEDRTFCSPLFAVCFFHDFFRAECCDERCARRLLLVS